MARRRIGQERFGFDSHISRATRSLDEILTLIDWAELDRTLARRHLGFEQRRKRLAAIGAVSCTTTRDLA